MLKSNDIIPSKASIQAEVLNIFYIFCFIRKIDLYFAITINLNPYPIMGLIFCIHKTKPTKPIKSYQKIFI